MDFMDEDFDGFEGDPYDEYEGWCEPRPPLIPSEPMGPNFDNNRYDRYNNAFGDYRGGYGPGGGFGPPPFLGGPMGPIRHRMGPPPAFLMGRGFGPQGPPNRRAPFEEKALKYLARCGVAREHLKNLPRDLLKLIEPGYCGLCAQSFETFVISRTHYVSKNHLKNQTKWVSQQREGPMAPRDMPFRARDLYCELCDVQITSKQHSESHYSGKPHRAIVEGRKIPRNPFLIQAGMEDRLAQLIRREKKHLKAVQEPPQEVLKEDDKPMQPELYCEICKTSVTCTEQMTMHKNGKRHLSKEKQFILRMMKGDTANSDKKEETDYQENNQGENEEAENGESAEKTDNGDWGNGQEEQWEEAAESVEAEAK